MSKPNRAGKVDTTWKTGRAGQHQWSQKITKYEKNEQSDGQKGIIY